MDTNHSTSIGLMTRLSVVFVKAFWNPFFILLTNSYKPKTKTENSGRHFLIFVRLFMIADCASNSENHFISFHISVQTLRTANGSFPGGQWQVSSSNVERAHVKPCKLNCLATYCYICFLFSCLFFVLCLFICFIKVSLFLLCTGFTNNRFLSSGL